MADKQHAALTEADGLHECKGIAAASSGDLQVADGAGSAIWESPAAAGLALTADGVTGGGPYLDIAEKTTASIPDTPDTGHSRLFSFALGDSNGTPTWLTDSGGLCIIPAHPSWSQHQHIHSGNTTATLTGIFRGSTGSNPHDAGYTINGAYIRHYTSVFPANGEARSDASLAFLQARPLTILRFAFARAGAGFGNCKLFMGFVHNSNMLAEAASPPAGNGCVGLRYFDTAGDTYWSFMAHNDTSMATLVPTTVTPVENTLYSVVIDTRLNGDEWVGLFDAKGAMLDSHLFVAADCPALSLPVDVYGGIRQTSAGTASLYNHDHVIYFRGQE